MLAAVQEQVNGLPTRAIRHRSVQPQGALHRVMSTLMLVAGFGVVALVLHEFFHFVVLRALGGDGYLTFDMELGLTHFTLLPSHLWLVHLSGGLLTGAFLLVGFWYWARSSGSSHLTNVEVVAFAWALGHIAYAPTELITSSPLLGAIGFGVGFGVAVILYFTKLMNWLASGDPDFQPSGQSAGNDRPLDRNSQNRIETPLASA